MAKGKLKVKKLVSDVVSIDEAVKSIKAAKAKKAEAQAIIEDGYKAIAQKIIKAKENK